MTVNISSSPPVLHHTPNPATLICRATLTRTHSNGLAVEMMWSKGGHVLRESTLQPLEYAPEEHPNATGVVSFESTLTMHRLKPSDNGTYTCSAHVVGSSSRQYLSSPVTASMDMHVLGKWEALVCGCVRDVQAPNTPDCHGNTVLLE